MLVTLLGTGASAGVPMIGGPDGSGDWGECDPAEPRNRRTRSSIVIEADTEREGGGPRLLVDTSPDMREQLLACRIPRVDAILYTHAHADHITGLDDVRALNRTCGHPLDAFATEATLAEITRRFPYAFRPWEPPGFYRPVLVPRPVAPGDTFEAAGEAAGMSVTVFDQDHGTTHTLGLRIGRFGYSTDVVGLDEPAIAVLAGVDTWVVDCFQRAEHSTHGYLDLVLAWSAQLGVRRTVLTHMGTDMDWAWLKENLPADVEPGYDGMRIEVR
jgi:phosphoribosyl 1,2-cyclic phosphate phosphodiesterase